MMVENAFPCGQGASRRDAKMYETIARRAKQSRLPAPKVWIASLGAQLMTDFTI
jgi:hypothetical protein